MRQSLTDLNRKTVETQLKCYNARDLEGFCACYHSEVIVEWIVSGRQISKGMDAFKAKYQKLFASSPALHCEVKHRSYVGETIIDEEFVTGISGIEDGLHTVAIYGFRDGLIDRVWFLR